MEAREPVGCEIIIIKNLPPSGTALFITLEGTLNSAPPHTFYQNHSHLHTGFCGFCCCIRISYHITLLAVVVVRGRDAGGGLFIYTLSTVTLLLKLNRFLVGGVYTRDECEPYKWGPWTQSSAQLNSDQFATSCHGADEWRWIGWTLRLTISHTYVRVTTRTMVHSGGKVSKDNKGALISTRLADNLRWGCHGY